MEERARRVAYNQTIFRAGNEALRRNADAALDRIPFICECGDESCLGTVPLSRDGYEAVRAHPRRFLTVPGHETRGGDSYELVDRADGVVVIEKLAEAGRIAEEQDPRRDGR